MSKTKLSGPQHYELLYVVTNRLTEDEAKKTIVRINKFVSEAEGTITQEEYWGKKRLAYNIKGDAYGYYQLIDFDLERNALAKLDEKLRLDTEVLRFIIVGKKLKSEEQIKKEQKITEKINSKKADKEKAAKAKSQATEVKTKTSKTKTDIANLDEKLEGILNANDLL